MLANFKVEDTLTEQINYYLSNNQWTFTELKALILRNKPIIEIQIKFEALLLKAHNLDLANKKQNLEIEMLKKQRAEDLLAHQNDSLKKAKDEQFKKRLNQELKKISSSIERYLNEQQIINQQTAQISLAKLALGQSQYYAPSNQLHYSMQQHEINVNFLHEKSRIIRNKLFEIEQRSTAYNKKEGTRDLRKLAENTYQNTPINISQSLSEPNKALLNKNIKAYIQNLKKRKAQLSLESEARHFTLFLQLLNDQLVARSLNPQELSAVQAVIKLIQKHNQYQSDLNLFQESLAMKTKLISNLLAQVDAWKEKIRALNKQAPVKKVNEQLADKTKAFKATLEKHTSLQKYLKTFTWLSLGLTCLFLDFRQPCVTNDSTIS